MNTSADFPGLTWTKSSYSLSSCLEMARPDDVSVAVRDSKDSTGPLLRFTAGGWTAFRSAIGTGRL
ncbi:DUF397 domain-containing protein [Streptomyces clavuligerus]|uniref:DUF397 domain-containing protein n=1 Tax=Streptomyces clavuligerus TaxID=1901 RepID=B5GLN0_STRCL|nr:DUF397 domain-containing protein [Streptomyces clavuligerus]EDY47226.1 hypothetical protein SSCG_00254 [Streptomyces clavuligerus]EFG04892.1 DUF397 domain-containing protein [Streptomyces clavuligerus]MBY6306669.1 DUF397 domain-containing protein [Streptomyces clavuligerus]QCS10725.1 DUF397 domain-containing protein [Streptomyces clavuligerus]QPJ97240.1 DUF397 domain-containing protein [Streptomyces clavuligerus]